MHVEEVSFSPAQLCADVMSVMRVRADSKKLPLLLTWETPVPERIASDPMRLRQILINLLSNAVKFTPAGGAIRLTATRDAASGDLVITVADTGIGIAPADIQRVMEPFGQVDNAINRKFRGTGLGLPLTKGLVELHGGSFKLESTPGVGTTVTIRLPAHRLKR